MPLDLNFRSRHKVSGLKRLDQSAWRREQGSGSSSWTHEWRLTSGQCEERLSEGLGQTRRRRSARDRVTSRSTPAA